MMLFYKNLMHLGRPFLEGLLSLRCRRGKEDPARLRERMGIASRDRPPGQIIWVHAASVGEAQSALILIDALKAAWPDCHVLVTTGTRTSALLMGQRLSGNAFHQYMPLDHEEWVERFLDHWRPGFVLWMESELWPNTLTALAARKIPAILVNARLSPKSFRRWKLLRGMIGQLLDTFNVVLAQTGQDAQYFRLLGAKQIRVTDNLKYSADTLPVDSKALAALRERIGNRPVWLFSSTHDGEEQLACRVHAALKTEIPDLLTIVAPRHPARTEEIIRKTAPYGLDMITRAPGDILPGPQDDIYLANTLGELGLFYTLSPVSVIGRSFSLDGGGGHNPIEAAQLNSAVLHGPNVQNWQQVYHVMASFNAAVCVRDETELTSALRQLLTNREELENLQHRGHNYALSKSCVLERVMGLIVPVMTDSGFPKPLTEVKPWTCSAV